MPLPLDDPFDDFIHAAPRSPAAAAARWRAACAAVAGAFPELVGTPGAAVQGARPLRVAFAAIDLHVFHCTFLGLFELSAGTYWAWRLDRHDGPLDAWVESTPMEEAVIEDGLSFTRRDVQHELVVSAPGLARAFPVQGPAVARFDGFESGSVIDAIVGAFGRRMQRLAALEAAYGAAEADRKEVRLLRLYGPGPEPPRDG